MPKTNTLPVMQFADIVAYNVMHPRYIRHELETYNELLGGPGELGCTLLIEIDDEEGVVVASRTAVFGVPDERLGEDVGAVVVLKHGAVGDADALKAFASQLIVLHHLVAYGPLSEALRLRLPRLVDWLYYDGRLAVHRLLDIGAERPDHGREDGITVGDLVRDAEELLGGGVDIEDRIVASDDHHGKGQP